MQTWPCVDIFGGWVMGIRKKLSTFIQSN
jgi:hypothetical protein